MTLESIPYASPAAFLFARSDWSSRSCASGTVDSSRGPQLVVADVGIEQHRAELAVAVTDPVDGLALRLEHVVEAGLDQLAVGWPRRPPAQCLSRWMVDRWQRVAGRSVGDHEVHLS